MCTEKVIKECKYRDALFGLLNDTDKELHRMLVEINVFRSEINIIRLAIMEMEKIK